MAKNIIVKARLSQEDVVKLQSLATVTDGNVSEAIRMMIHAAILVVKPMTVIDFKQPEQEARNV